MFTTLANFATGAAKIAVGAVVAPVALVADVVSLPATADDYRKHPFEKTSGALGLVGEGLKDTVKGEK
jgi:hypothetical protein